MSELFHMSNSSMLKFYRTALLLTRAIRSQWLCVHVNIIAVEERL